MPKILLLISIAFSLFSCSSEKKTPVTVVDETFGSIQLRIAVGSSSPFKSLVRSGTVTVSAQDMTTLVSELSLDDSTVSARVEGVPTGKARLVEIKALDSAGTVRYRGSTSVDIAADSTSQAAINLIRLTGTLVVNGTVVENDSTPPAKSTALPSPKTLTIGAQASAIYGASLDIDTQMVWSSATANANQEKIDLIFMFYAGAFHLDDAVTAQAAGITHSINLTNSLDRTRIKSVDMVKLTSMPASQEAAKRAFESGTVIHGSVVVAGDRLMVKTTEGKLALIRVTAVTGSSNTGNAVLELYPLTLP